jgi:hypothetical protein
LTIEAKTATGFGISYIYRDVTVDGNAPIVTIMRPIVGVLKDTVIRGSIDSAGKPISVDNIDEVRATMRAFFDSTLKAIDAQPNAAATLRPTIDSMLNADGLSAAKTDLRDLDALSAGQNTGLKLGETRHESIERASPLGGAPIKVATTFRIEQADPKSGDVTFVRDSQTDPEGIKEFMLDMTRKFGSPKSPPNVAEAIKAMKLTIDGRTTINVEDGMARMLREESTTTLMFMGRTFINTKVETITVTQAP